MHSELESRSNFADEEKQDGQNMNTQKQQEKSSKWFIFELFIYYIQIQFTSLQGLLMMTPHLFRQFGQGTYGEGFKILWAQICCFANLYSLILFFFLKIEDVSIKYFFLDGLCFQQTCFLVFAYIKTLYIAQDQKDFQSNICDTDLITTVMYMPSSFLGRRSSYYFDSVYLKHTQLGEISSSSISKYFQYFSIKNEHPKFLEYKNLIKIFRNDIFANVKQHFILILLIGVKLAFCFRYVYLQLNGISHDEMFQLVVILLIYFYNAVNLNRIFGNYDLRRKTETLDFLNDVIDFSDADENTHEQKLDITCPRSIEAWENSRKTVLEYKKEFIETLELSYSCLVFYYFFALSVCMSAYFELYWIIQNESIFLSPLIVIMNSFTFIILSCFILFRIQYGNDYNDRFDVLESTVGSLIDTFKDLQSMFDEFFLPETQLNEDNVYYVGEQNESKGIEKERRHSQYGLLITKIKQKSRYYIKNKKEFQGKMYSINELNQLRRQMIINTQQCLAKSREQIHSDSKVYKYKFLNSIEISFYDAFSAIAFTIVTSLPTIVPKLVGFYNIHKKE